jgi:hypothetical protein
MKSILALTFALAASISTEAYAQKPVALISGNGNVSIDSNNVGAGLNQTTISKHDQTMEMAQDFLAAPSTSTELPTAAIVEAKPAPNSATTVAVIVQPTASAQKYCKPETISAVLSDANAYLTSKGMTIGTTATSSRTMVLIVNRPISKWIEITVQERDHAGNVLWSEKVSDSGWGHLGTTGLLNTLEKVHKIIDAKIPESRASTPNRVELKN